MSRCTARVADRAGKIEVAADLYEKALAAGDCSLERFLELALLYWQATDPGLAAAKTLPPDFLTKAEQRARELLDEAHQAFSESTAVRFWMRYVRWADLGEPLGVEECRAMVAEDPTVLVPAMHVFAATQGQEMQAEAHELLRRCKEDGTTGAQYIASVIEATIKRARHRPHTDASK